MRQLGDLIIWIGMIVLTVGVVYFTPLVAEYVTSEPSPQIIKIPRNSRTPHIQHPSPQMERSWQ